MRSRLSLKTALVFLFLFLLLTLSLFRHQSVRQASDVQTTSVSQIQFIKAIAPIVQKAAKAYGVKPSIIIGQAALETNYGNSLLAKKYHNLFSLKASDGQEKVTLLQKIYSSKGWTTRSEDFVIYSNYSESIYDYLLALKNGRFWDEELYRQLVSGQTYVDDAKALQEYYFSSDPDYATKLSKVIKDNKLERYDK
ncbi:glycoside hydrolase family 73 protein [Streptococcus orisratti]|uniref:glycoside hydrolase family 73 protein n=1 Tax=Streptococcus orisratti TaxID=114652 RepID=UPI00036B7E26|nr:glucosaminidase domain-containing protein [Streptococcus orisratti]